MFVTRKKRKKTQKLPCGQTVEHLRGGGVGEHGAAGRETARVLGTRGVSLCSSWRRGEAVGDAGQLLAVAAAVRRREEVGEGGAEVGQRSWRRDEGRGGGAEVREGGPESPAARISRPAPARASLMRRTGRLDAAALGAIPASKRAVSVEEGSGRAAGGAPTTSGGGEGGGATGGWRAEFSSWAVGPCRHGTDHF